MKLTREQEALVHQGCTDVWFSLCDRSIPKDHIADAVVDHVVPEMLVADPTLDADELCREVEVLALQYL